MSKYFQNCEWCSQPFIRLHGNQKHCEGCAYLKKKESVPTKYLIYKDAKKALEGNYKLFQRYAGDNAKTTLLLNKLLNKGFDQFGFYQFKEKNGTWYYYVHDYMFSINENTITIWKL